MVFFFFNDTATTEIYTLSLHDALPIFAVGVVVRQLEVAARAELHGDFGEHVLRWEMPVRRPERARFKVRSEEHTSELQSPCNLVCRLLLEKKNQDPLSLPIERTHHVLT